MRALKSQDLLLQTVWRCKINLQASLIEDRSCSKVINLRSLPRANEQRSETKQSESWTKWMINSIEPESRVERRDQLNSKLWYKLFLSFKAKLDLRVRIGSSSKLSVLYSRVSKSFPIDWAVSYIETCLIAKARIRSLSHLKLILSIFKFLSLLPSSRPNFLFRVFW
jgi:hypothetical protein